MDGEAVRDSNDTSGTSKTWMRRGGDTNVGNRTGVGLSGLCLARFSSSSATAGGSCSLLETPMAMVFSESTRAIACLFFCILHGSVPVSVRDWEYN